MGMAEYRVQFEVFEGPLDLLLHLVKKQEVDIYQVNLTRIATEFVTYIEQMRELDLEVAGEFVVMAATLLYIKSRELLPVDKQVVVAEEDEDEEDPRWELIRRLVEYKKFKDAAARLQVREGEMDSLYERRPARPDLTSEEPVRRGALSVFDLVNAVATILKRYNDRSSGDAGFVTLKYKNADVLFDGNSGIPSSHGYFIKTNYLQLVVHRDADLEVMDEMRPVNQDGVVVPVLWMGALTCSNRKLQGVIKA
jgi:hypothetical protein